MDVTDYRPIAREYSIWNATLASLQFWTADLDKITLGTAIKEVYGAFFYTTSTYTLHQQSDEILFSHFMTTLNSAFEWKSTLEDQGYKSSSGNFNIPTPQRKMPKIHHISNFENVSFNPDLITPCSMVQSHLRLVCRQLTYSSSNDSDTSQDTPTAPRATPTDAKVYPEEKDEEEDFQMVSLDDKHWTTKEVPDRTLCIHKHAQPHRLCPYPCPYVNYLLPSYANTMDLTDISDLKTS